MLPNGRGENLSLGNITSLMTLNITLILGITALIKIEGFILK